MRSKETVDIEALLDWTYRIQCADRRISALRPQAPALFPTATGFAAFADLGTRVDTSGVRITDLEHIKTDDALIVHDAVLRLSEMWLEWRAGDEVVVWDRDEAKAAGFVIEQDANGWWLHPLASRDAAVPVRLEQAGTAVLVIIHAKAGARPEVHERWTPPVGRAAADGCRRDRRGRLRRVVEGVSAGEVMHARAMYAVWRAALVLLAAELDGVLDGYTITGPEAPAEPWAKAPKRVLKTA